MNSFTWFIFPALDMAMFTIVLEALYPVIP